jgi:hypothetical protein
MLEFLLRALVTFVVFTIVNVIVALVKTTLQIKASKKEPDLTVIKQPQVMIVQAIFTAPFFAGMGVMFMYTFGGGFVQFNENTIAVCFFFLFSLVMLVLAIRCLVWKIVLGEDSFTFRSLFYRKRSFIFRNKACAVQKGI